MLLLFFLLHRRYFLHLRSTNIGIISKTTIHNNLFVAIFTTLLLHYYSRYSYSAVAIMRLWRLRSVREGV